MSEPKGWHLSGNNHKPHYFKKGDYSEESFKIPISICKKVSGYSGISKRPCKEIFKDDEYLKMACKYCIRLLTDSRKCN